MKILIINKFFYEKGGAETYSFALKKLLEANGHKVIDFSMSHENNNLSSYSNYFVKNVDYHRKEAWYKQIGKGVSFLYSLEAKRKLKMLIKTERPDIVHLQNYRHQLTTSIIKVLRKEKIPIIHTIHDLQLLCGNYKMLSQGRVCEKCKKGKHYQCFLNKCVNELKSYSFLSALEMYLNQFLLNKKDWGNFIVPSNFYKKKFIDYGYPEKNITFIPNFLEIEKYEPCYESKNYFIYLGRLSEEKGIFTLLHAMEIVEGARLILVGTGPLEEKIRTYIDRKGSVLKEKVKMTGFLKGKPLQSIMKDAMFHVLPSECYENGPYSVLEMMAMGKTVIVSDVGGLRDYVEEEKTGLFFQAGNKEELAKCIQRLVDNRELSIQLGKNARKKVEEEYSSSSYYEKLLSIYEMCEKKETIKIGIIGLKGIDGSLGGIEKHVTEIVNKLDKKKFQITIYTRKKYGKETSMNKEVRLCPTASLPGKGIEAAAYSFFASLKSLISKEQIIHYHGLGAGLMSPIPRIFGKKIVVTVHGLDWKREKWGILGRTYIKLGEKIVAKAASRIIVVNKNLKKYFKEKYGREAIYISNGVGDMKGEEKREMEYLLFLARLVPEKGCHILLEAFTRLHLPDINLVIAGGSSQTEKYTTQLIEKYQGKNIIFLGPVKGEYIKELYTNAILYILPSTVEGLPISLLEAMSSGTCPLVSDIEENLEVIKENGLYGYVFQKENPWDLALKIKELLNDRSKLKAVGEKARAYVLEDYTWDEAARKTAKIYKEI